MKLSINFLLIYFCGGIIIRHYVYDKNYSIESEWHMVDRKSRKSFAVLPVLFLLYFFTVKAHVAVQVFHSDEKSFTAAENNKAECYYHFSLGHVLEVQGKYQEAVKEYSKALEFDPQQPDIHIAIASAYYYNGKNEKAIEYCTRALAMDADNTTAHRLLGNIYFYIFINSKFDERYADLSITELEKVVALETDDDQSYLTLGKLYNFKKEYQQSLDYLFRHLQYDPHSPAGLQFIARDYINMGKFSEALEYLNKLKEILPRDSNVISLMAGVYQYLKNYDKIIELYQQYLKLKPDDVEIRSQLGSAYFENSQWQNAEAEFKKVLQAEPDDTAILNYLALTYHKLKKYDQAEKIFLQYLEKHPEDIEARYNLAKVYGESRDYEKAIETYAILLEEINKKKNAVRKEEHSIILANKGWVHFQKGEYHEAVEELRHAEELSPQLATNFNNLLIMSLHECGQSEEALKKCDEAIAQQPTDYTLYLIKSEIVADRGEPNEAIAMLQALIDEGNNNPKIYSGIANIYMEAKEYAQAEESLLAALKLFPGEEDLSFTLGAAYEKMGKLNLAEEVFKKIINKNPNHDKALNYLGYMLADKGTRLTEAIEYIKRALEIDSTNGSYLDSLGWAYYQLNQLSEAKKYLELAAKKEPRSAEIRSHLGDLYYRLGKLAKAIKHWQDALNLKPDDEQLIREKIEEAKKIQQ